jgi:hypothetical protein
MARDECEARLRDLTARGWTTELFAEFCARPDPKGVPEITTDVVVANWPGAKTVRGRPHAGTRTRFVPDRIAGRGSCGSRSARESAAEALTAGAGRDR